MAATSNQQPAISHFTFYRPRGRLGLPLHCWCWCWYLNVLNPADNFPAQRTICQQSKLNLNFKIVIDLGTNITCVYSLWLFLTSKSMVQANIQPFKKPISQFNIHLFPHPVFPGLSSAPLHCSQLLLCKRFIEVKVKVSSN